MDMKKLDDPETYIEQSHTVRSHNAELNALISLYSNSQGSIIVEKAISHLSRANALNKLKFLGVFKTYCKLDILTV